MARSRTEQQVLDLQNRIAELAEQGRLDLLTEGEVALVSYALGRYHAELRTPRSQATPKGKKKSNG